MRGLQLIIVLSTTFVLIAISGWALWHIWQEQELPAEVHPQTDRLTITVHIANRPLRSDQPAKLDPVLRQGVWHTYLWQPENTAGRTGALRALDSQMTQNLSYSGIAPGEKLRGVISADDGVDAAAIDSVRDILRGLGITDITVKAR